MNWLKRLFNPKQSNSLTMTKMTHGEFDGILDKMLAFDIQYGACDFIVMGAEFFLRFEHYLRNSITTPIDDPRGEIKTEFLGKNIVVIPGNDISFGFKDGRKALRLVRR